MKAFHLRTTEPDSYDASGLETFDLNSIYIPEEKFLFGFVDWCNEKKNRGLILAYTIGYSERAQCIVDGNRSGVFGDVIGEVDLSEGQINMMKRQYDRCRYEAGDRHTSIEVDLIQRFDKQTDTLVKILTGELIIPPLTQRIHQKAKNLYQRILQSV